MTTENDSLALPRAFKTHDLLRDLYIDVVQQSGRLKNPQAQKYFVQGVGRRLRLVFDGYRIFLKLIPPNRTKPLSHGEINETNLHLNSIYVHLRGSLDNFAWALLWEFDERVIADTAKSNIGLFAYSIKKNPLFERLSEGLTKYSDWAIGLRDLRDPVAHRIPLGIVPSIISNDMVGDYIAHNEKANEAMLRLDFDSADFHHDRMSEMGEFVPLFAHDYDEGTIPVYPTITDDVNKLVDIGRLVINFIVDQYQEY